MVKVSIKNGEVSITANAVANNIYVQMKNVQDGNYAVNIVNNAGQKVYEGNLMHTIGRTETIRLKTQLANGIYHLQVLVDGKIYSAPILIN